MELFSTATFFTDPLQLPGALLTLLISSFWFEKMPQFPEKNSTRFRGLIDAASGDEAIAASSDAKSYARYKQYIQIIYTPVSVVRRQWPILLRLYKCKLRI